MEVKVEMVPMVKVANGPGFLENTAYPILGMVVMEVMAAEEETAEKVGMVEMEQKSPSEFWMEL